MLHLTFCRPVGLRATASEARESQMENEQAILARIGNIVAGLGDIPLRAREDMITALRQIQLIVLTGEVREPREAAIRAEALRRMYGSGSN